MKQTFIMVLTNFFLKTSVKFHLIREVKILETITGQLPENDWNDYCVSNDWQSLLVFYWQLRFCQGVQQLGKLFAKFIGPILATITVLDTLLINATNYWANNGRLNSAFCSHKF